MIFSLILGIIIWRLYHKMFNVRYFGCKGIIIEFGACILIAYYILVAIFPSLM